MRNVVKPSGLITFLWANHGIACYAARIVKKTWCGVSVAKLGFMRRVPVAPHRSYNATCVNYSRRTMFATFCFSAINFHFKIVLQLIVLLLRQVGAYHREASNTNNINHVINLSLNYSITDRRTIVVVDDIFPEKML